MPQNEQEDLQDSSGMGQAVALREEYVHTCQADMHVHLSRAAALALCCAPAAAQRPGQRPATSAAAGARGVLLRPECAEHSRHRTVLLLRTHHSMLPAGKSPCRSCHQHVGIHSAFGWMLVVMEGMTKAPAVHKPAYARCHYCACCSGCGLWHSVLQDAVQIS